MDLNFKINTTKTHFNATTILKQVNADFASKKRLNEFSIQTKIKLTCDYVDTARLDHIERYRRNAGPRDTRPEHFGDSAKLRIPSISVVGGGVTKTTWLHLSLLPLFLYWLHPQVYARFFAAPQTVAALGKLGSVGEI